MVTTSKEYSLPKITQPKVEALTEEKQRKTPGFSI
jgi:hypothetical protein